MVRKASPEGRGDEAFVAPASSSWVKRFSDLKDDSAVCFRLSMFSGFLYCLFLSAVEYPRVCGVSTVRIRGRGVGVFVFPGVRSVHLFGCPLPSLAGGATFWGPVSFPWR